MIQTDSVWACICVSYLYDLLQRAQPGETVLLEQITGAVLNQHGEQAEPLKPMQAHANTQDKMQRSEYIYNK